MGSTWEGGWVVGEEEKPDKWSKMGGRWQEKGTGKEI